MLECLEKEEITTNEIGSDKRQSIKTTDGTIVSLFTKQGREKITIHSDMGHIIFEYQPDTKKCHFYVPEGDLHFNAPTGSVSIASGRDIQLKCPGDIIMQGQSNVKLRSGEPSRVNAALTLGQQEAKVSGAKVTIEAEQGDFSIIKARMRSRRLSAKIDRARFTLDNLEILAETMHQKANNLYQSAENLYQVNAGRMRMFIRGLFNLKGDRTYLKANKDMKLKGDKIHLR